MFSVSSADMLISLKTFSLRAFQIIHKIHGKHRTWSNSRASFFNLQNNVSKLVKRASLGKLVGSIHVVIKTWCAIEQLKRMWFVVSGSVSQRGQRTSKPIRLLRRFYLEAKQPHTSCHIKCFILHVVLSFQAPAWSETVLDSETYAWPLELSRFLASQYPYFIEYFPLFV